MSLVTSRDLNIVSTICHLKRYLIDIPLAQGKVFSAVFSPDDSLTLAAAGSKAKMQIWDVGANFGARKVFGPKLAAAGRALKEKEGGGVVGVQSDDEGSEGDEDD